MSQKNDLKDYEDQAANLNPGDNWREAVSYKNEPGNSEYPSDENSGSEDTGHRKTDNNSLSKKATKNQDEVRDKEADQPSPINYTGRGGKTKKGKMSGGKGPLLAVFGGLSMSVVVIGLIGNMFSSVLVNTREKIGLAA